MNVSQRMRSITDRPSRARREDVAQEVQTLFSEAGLGIVPQGGDEERVADPDLVFSMIRSQIMEAARLILTHTEDVGPRQQAIQTLKSAMRWVHWSLWKRETGRDGRG